MENKLLGCPFCGGQPEITPVFEGMEDTLGFMLTHICFENEGGLLGDYCFIKILKDTANACKKSWNTCAYDYKIGLYFEHQK